MNEESRPKAAHQTPAKASIGKVTPARRYSVEDTLTQAEATSLDVCEQTIDRGVNAFIEVGAALLRIRDCRLYRTTYATFTDYCSERFPQLSRSSVYRAMGTAQVVEIVSPIGDVPNEAQARELAPLRDQPDAMREAWSATVADTGGKPTAAALREQAGRHKPPSVKVAGIRDYFSSDTEAADVLGMADASEEDFERALQQARAEDDLSRDNVAAKVRRRRPLPDAWWHAVYELEKAAERLERLSRDDRMPANRDAIVTRTAGSLAQISETLRQVQRRAQGRVCAYCGKELSRHGCPCTCPESRPAAPSIRDGAR